jgi:hypothetical protein
MRETISSIYNFRPINISLQTGNNRTTFSQNDVIKESNGFLRGVERDMGIRQKSLLSCVLTTLILPLNAEFVSRGEVTETWINWEPSLGVRSLPFLGEKDHNPQVGYDSIFQSRNEPASPLLANSKLPLTVSPGFTSVQRMLPEQSKSEKSN